MQKETVRIEKTYRDLKVFKLSYELGLKVHKISLNFPKYENYALASQLRSSSKSIAVNIAEGMSRQLSASETIRFLKMAIGSCEETRIWLNFAFDLDYIDKQSFYELDTMYDEVGKMISGLIKHWILKI